MTDRKKIEEIFSELRNFADNDVHPVVSPENWHVYSKLHDLIDRAEEDAFVLLKEQEAVIRCKDCKHFDGGRLYKCRIHGSLFQPKDADWFCADVECKEGR